MTLWHGRISATMADAVAAFTVSLPFDQVLAPDDLAGSRAHVKGLGKAGILTDSEVGTLVETLDLVEEEFATGQFVSPHGLAVDSRGDIYVGEVSFTNWGRRVSAKARSFLAFVEEELKLQG